MIKLLKKIFICDIMGIHTWTCNAEKGIKATPEQLKSVEGFWDYAKMYCDCCGKHSKLNK